MKVILKIEILFFSIFFLLFNYLVYSDELLLKNDYGINYGEPYKYIITGNQSEISNVDFENLKKEIDIEQINIINDLRKIFIWIHNNFKNVSDSGKFVGKKTIDEIIKSKIVGGCHDHGLILVSILRKYNIPSIYVDTTGINWALDYPEKIKYFIGHVFVEIFINNKWILMDSNSGEYIENYDPKNPVIPIKKTIENKGFFVMYKGLDPENYGITDIKILNNEQIKFSNKIKKNIDKIVFPEYIISKF